MACLSISVLGSMTVSLDGHVDTSFSYDKVRALLAYLAAESERPHRREALACLLWPDQSEKAAHDSLRNALAKLRHAIGDQEAQPPYLLINHEEIQFNGSSDHWLDVERFTQLLGICRTHRHRRIEACPTCTDRLIEAVNLYRGEFLGGFSLPDSDLFDEWLKIKRERFSKSAMEALQQMASTYEWRDELARALEFTERQLELDPCDEEAYVQALRLLGSMGKRSEACELYEKCRELLADELGVEPTEETSHLYEQIKYGVFHVAPSRQSLRINNLPTDLTSFVGRVRELEEINALIEDPTCRLLSLVGPGGVGKTRLAIAATSHQLEAFPHGACFVPLAGTNSIELIIPAVLQSLGLKQAEQGDLRDQLTSYLKDKELVLVLDNFEHLIEGANLVNEILQHSPGIMILVTSRQRLGLQAEWAFEVNGLSYPSGKAVQDLAAYEAVQLFTARLRQVKPRQTVFTDDLPGMSRICQLVEGLPLGIELAASAVRRRSIEQVATAIESGTEDLIVSYKDVPERHRSIRAVFEHSYRLLNQEEQAAFCGLAVFRGGFTAEAAQQVAEATMDLLDSLVEHSMVRFDPEKELYNLHELVRQYGVDKLRSMGMEIELRHRHGYYFLQALKRWGTELEGTGQKAALNEMEQELPDLRTAWEWACQHNNLKALELGHIGLCRFYHWRSHPLEGEQDCQEALKIFERMIEQYKQDQLFKVQLLTWKSLFMLLSSHITLSEHKKNLERSLKILEDLKEASVDVQLELAFILRWISESTIDPDQAIKIGQRSLEITRQIGNKRYMAFSLKNLARTYFVDGKFYDAERYCLDSLSVWRSLGDPGQIAEILLYLSEISAHFGKMELALQSMRESAQLYFALGDQISRTSGLVGMALGFYHNGEWDKADKYYADSLSPSQVWNDRESRYNAYSNWSMVKLFSGRYEEARMMAESNYEFAIHINDPYSMMINLYTLGGVALAQDRPEEANPYLENSTNTCNQNLIHFILAQVVGTWSIALYRSGNIKFGYERMMESIQTGVRLHSYTNLSFAVPAAALYLAINGQAERAVELCGLIDEKAMCGKTPWFEDVAGKTIKEMAADLPPEVVEAARERGRQRDLFVTAAELLEELIKQPQ
jgi:predicted ATPase/DNA-binding SARP family transcriptional activator